MTRQGIYTRKVGKVQQAQRSLKRLWRWFKKLSWKKKLLYFGGPLLLLLIIIPIATYIYYYNDIADQERLMNRNNTGIVLKDIHGDTFYSTGRAQQRDLLGLDKISDTMEEATIASEDKDFYKHEGFSVSGISRALFNNVSSGSITGGGSTITQQLAKNTLLSEQQTFMRKYQELVLSIAIEQRYEKDDILSMYLNSAYFGGNVFGIQEAADFYYGKSPNELNLAESSMLVGILPAPNSYSPTLGNPEYAKERQETVLTRMADNGYITQEEKESTLDTKITYKEATPESSDSEAPHFAEMVLKELGERFGEEKVRRSGYQVTTTLDLNTQRQLKSGVDNNLAFIEANGGSNASGVAIDPSSGQIRALVGSADYNNKDWGNVNMVTTPRQPGSSFKPIYYSAALADGVITPSTIEEDVPTDFNGYEPQNADRSFSGDITIRNALSRSLNIPSVKVMRQYGIEKSIAAANRMGIDTIDNDKDYGLSLALGSAEASLLNMTNAYAAFANQGDQFNTTTVQTVNDKYNNEVYSAEAQTSEQVISEQGAYLISSILSDNNARAPTFGSSLTVPGKTVAVKTGTTDDSRDAWTIGYTPKLAVGVWVGNNNNDVMLNGGSGMAGPIWRSTMTEALASQQDTGFSVPEGVVQRAVCFSNGGLANQSGEGTYAEYFLAGSLPTTTCQIEDKVEEEKEQRPPEEEEEAPEEEAPVEEEPVETPEEEVPQDGTDGDGTGTDPGSGSDGGGDTGNGPLQRFGQ